MSFYTNPVDMNMSNGFIQSLSENLSKLSVVNPIFMENPQITQFRNIITLQQNEIEELKKENTYLKKKSDDQKVVMSHNEEAINLCRSLINEKTELLSQIESKIQEINEIKEKNSQYADYIINLQQNIGFFENEINELKEQLTQQLDSFNEERDEIINDMKLKTNHHADIISEMKIKINDQVSIINELTEDNKRHVENMLELKKENTKQSNIIVDLKDTIQHKIKDNKPFIEKIDLLRKALSFCINYILIFLGQTEFQFKYGYEFIEMHQSINNNYNNVNHIFNKLKCILLEYFYITPPPNIK
jgi:chromosome segregation ATPase